MARTSTKRQSVDTLVHEGAALLTEIIDTQGKATAMLRRLAEIVVDIRLRYKDETGARDLRGKTGAYKAKIEEMYREAGIGPDSAFPIQAALRYHVSPALRKRVTPEELEAAGMIFEPAGQRKANRTSSESVIFIDMRRSPTPSLLIGEIHRALSYARTVFETRPADPETLHEIEEMGAEVGIILAHLRKSKGKSAPV